MPLNSGESFAGFRIIRLLGSGGMGEVYLAQHPRLPRRDALKLLPKEWSADLDYRARFNREADLASTLWHPHIVGVHDRGEADGQLWISMDFVDGVDAGRLLADRYPAGMPLDEVAKIVTAVASALDYAHKQGLLHRDVKPANIMLTHVDDEGEQRVLLTDFGIARNVDDISGLTTTNMTVGTVAYCAPEQLMGEDVDGRADQYALAATAYHLLTGSQLFPHSNPAVVISRHLNAAPPRLGDLRPDLDAHSGALARGLSKHPDERFPTCTAFARALSGGAAAPVTRHGEGTDAADTRPAPVAPPRAAAPAAPTPSAAAKPLVRTTTVLSALLAVLLIGLVTFVGLQISKTRQPSPTPATAQPTPPPVPVTGTPVPAACGDFQALLAGMSTRDKLAQLLMVGVTGAADARAVVDSHHVGGIMIGSWTDLSILSGGSLADIAGSAGPLPLAVSVDEEGGRFSALAALIGSQPSPRVLAASHTPEEVYNIALQRGQAMRKLGITIDFAPVVDVTTESDDEVIGDRSFGAEPATVTDYAGAYARGLRDAGLLPVLKHFPGYGHGSGDAHTESVVTPPLVDLQYSDLVPYRTLTTQSPVGVMVGHMQVPGLTGSDPASLSPAAYALLRSGDYGGPPFGGPVFTDDLSSMGAINQRYSVSEAVLRALQAGADTALWVTTDEVPAVLDRLEKALAAGELSTAQLDASVLKLAGVKGPNPRC